MTHHSASPPYFDGLFRRLANDDPQTLAAFGRHVHWGYWRDPPSVTCSAEEYGLAAEALCGVVCDAAEIRDGMRILDVGCGFGGTIASLNERYSDLQMVGVNIDPRQLERARQTVHPGNGNSIEFVEADAARIPLSDESYDVILAVECIFHFNRPEFLSEVNRLLVPGGSLTLSDFVPAERALEYLEGIDMSQDDGVRWSFGEIDLSCSLRRYRELANANKLELIESIDITDNTIPTYDFLYSTTSGWTDEREVELFTRATRLLEKASRSGLIGYQILRFAHNVDSNEFSRQVR